MEGLDKVRELGNSTRFKEKGVEDSILLESPGGVPLLFYKDMEYVGDLRLKFYLHRGVSPVKLAHVNYVVGNLEREERFSRTSGSWKPNVSWTRQGGRQWSGSQGGVTPTRWQ